MEIEADSTAAHAGTSMQAHERCTKQSAVNARKSAKYLSSRPKASLFTAGTVSPSERATKFLKSYKRFDSERVFIISLFLFY
jgi:hypothetical protein